MEDFNSKYTGEEVENILDSVGGKQDAISDLEAIRSGAEKGTTAVQPASLANYVSKDDVDAALSETSANPIQNQAVMNTLLEWEAVLIDLFAQKQPVISDLATIREGASKGATSAQLYITPFDVLSLYDLAHNPHEVGGIQSNNQAITDALTANKIVLVPYAIGDESIKGYAPLVGYVEDLLYFKVITDSYEIYVETSRDADDILGQQVTYRDWYSKQDTLKSGENIKTINGESIVGSGDITIKGGGGSNNVWVDAGTATRCTLTPNTTTHLTIGGTSSDRIVINEELPSNGDTATLILYISDHMPQSISLPHSFWANNNKPVFGSGNSYEISFMRTPQGLFSLYTIYTTGVGGTDPA
ncbi:MAG: hypothetical protein UF228_07980 [Lachnospiraceae bacterium]|nr:hypothetical protein [Lachnospiraceae bacterium]